MAAMLALLPLLLAQNAAPDLTARFDVPDGVEVSLWAQSPQLYNPTAIDVDAEGRVWVAEAVNYRTWGGRNPGRRHPDGDRIVVLVDHDADGAADESIVFAQDEELVSPLGVAVIGDRVYVSCSPHLLVYRDTDGDLRADEREVFLTGFGGHDHDHGLHSVVGAPGGGLLWCVGNAGPHLVEAADGWNLRSGSLYNGGGASHPGNRPGLVSDDGVAWTGGLIGRIGDDGTGMRVLAHNFRNEYEVAADAYGELYTADNDDDGNASCRTVALINGGNYGYFGLDGATTWQADRRPHLDTQAAHWHQDDPGVMPSGTINGGGGPTGVVVYEGQLLPGLEGAVLNADAGRSLVWAHVPLRQGAALDLRRLTLIRPSADGAGERGRWFRPSDVAVHPDGSILVADWYDPGVGGHAAGDREAYGRILRLAPNTLATAYGMLNVGLDSPAPNVRATAERALLAADDDLPEALPRDKRSQARRLWLAAQRERDRAQVVAALRHEDPALRLAAYRALTTVLGPDAERAADMAADADARVRAAVAASLRTLPWEDAGPTLIALARSTAFDADWASDPGQRVLLEAIGLGATGKEEELFTALLQQHDDTYRLLPFAWRLHPAGARLWLADFAQAAGRPLAERRRAIDALAFQPEREAAETVLTLALAGPADTREHAAWWVRHRATNQWSGHGLEDALAGDLARAERIWESELLESGAVPVDLELTDAEVLWLLVEDGGNGISYDWAAWCEPTVHLADGTTLALHDRAWLEAEAGWGQVRRNAAAGGGPIRVDGEVVAHGIGTHAASRIAFRLPPGATRFTARAAADDGGAAQAGSQTSVRLAVAVERAVDPAARRALEAAAVAGDADALQTLLDDVHGALFLLERARAGALDDSVLSELRPRLRGHADLGVRALASEVFPATTADGEALPPLDVLAALPASPARGRELFRGAGTCATCHTYDGLGGPLGPDLSGVHDKLGKRELLDAMINPSAGIAFGYDSWTLILQDGSVVVGSILADGEQVVVRGLDGVRRVIPAGEIASRRKQQVSTMPAAPALGLGAQELADLAAFLSQRPGAEPRFGEEVVLFDGNGLAGWQPFLPGDGDAAEVWSVRDGVLRCEGRPIGYLHTEQQFTNFELTLEWRFDPEAGAGNSGVLLRVQQPHRVWPHSIEAQLHSGNAGDIWNIGAFPMLTDAERTNGRRTVKALPSNEKPLGEWNRYRIRLDGGRLTLEVNGRVQNTARWCEEKPGVIALQSEGAVIEFRDIRLRPILD